MSATDSRTTATGKKNPAPQATPAALLATLPPAPPAATSTLAGVGEASAATSPVAVPENAPGKGVCSAAPNADNKGEPLAAAACATPAASPPGPATEKVSSTPSVAPAARRRRNPPTPSLLGSNPAPHTVVAFLSAATQPGHDLPSASPNAPAIAPSAAAVRNPPLSNTAALSSPPTPTATLGMGAPAAEGVSDDRGDAVEVAAAEVVRSALAVAVGHALTVACSDALISVRVIAGVGVNGAEALPMPLEGEGA